VPDRPEISCAAFDRYLVPAFEKVERSEPPDGAVVEGDDVTPAYHRGER
jgi:hypothetical protein